MAEAFLKIQTMPKPVILKQKPPTFNGAPENARLWLKEYQIVANLNNWSNKEKAQYLSTAFTDKAKTWFEGQYDGEIPEWDDFECRFNDNYQTTGYNHRKLCEFYLREQQEGENPIEYLDQLIKLRNEITPKPTDSEVVARAKRGVTGRYTAAVINIEDLKELRSTLNKMVEAFGEKDKQRKTQSKPVTTTAGAQKPSQPAQNVKYTSRPTISAQPPKEFKITCYNCDRVGHYSKQCPEPKDVNKITQNFANVQNARNPYPRENLYRNEWRPPNRQNQYNQSSQGYNQWVPPEPIAGPSGQPSNALVPTAQQNMFSRDRRRRQQPKHDKMVEQAQKSYENLRICTLPTLDIVIGGQKTEALVDTGGAYSLMSIDLVIALGLELSSTELRLRGVGDSEIGVVGRALRVPVLFDRYVVEVPFVVVHTLLPHVILGVDFIEATNLVIHSQSGKMQFFVKRSITGKSPCSDSELEESVKKGERPPYRMRHATQAEKKYLSEGTNAYIRRRTPAERASYTEANLESRVSTKAKAPK